ncbi:DUF4412 domain-containing protein [Flavobacteriaceae bacterium F08102]|nr:DUF4412 domain-containing protein [Flavobacteriaceae bacterium F08102]
MKSTRIICFLCICFCAQPSQAQFLKKLTDKVTQKVENTVVDKTANKAAEKVSKTMDKAFETNPFATMGNSEKVSPENIADSYDFSWKYSLKMTTKDGNMVIDYYLKPDASYFGFTSMAMKNMFTVMDNERKVMVMFMQSDQNPMILANSMPDNLDTQDTKTSSFEFETLPNKNIMGYACKGIKATNDRYEIVMYFTSDAPVSFNDLYKKQHKNIPAGLENYFDKDDRVLMLEMQMTDLKKSKMSATMECVGLEKELKTIHKREYTK